MDAQMRHNAPTRREIELPPSCLTAKSHPLWGSFSKAPPFKPAVDSFQPEHADTNQYSFFQVAALLRPSTLSGTGERAAPDHLRALRSHQHVS